MYFNRFDICEAWYLYLCFTYEGQWSKKYQRLSKLTGYFKPSPFLSVDELTENGREIFNQLMSPYEEETN